MTKSTPSTSTTSVNNPTANAQLPFLQQIWGSAANMAGQPDPYLSQLAGYTQGQFNTTQGPAGGVMPSALNFTSGILSGTYPQASMPGGPQIGALMNTGNQASTYGNSWAMDMADIASGAPSTIAPYTSGITGAANAFMPVGYAGYGQASDINQIASAAGAGAASAPGAVSPYVGTLMGLSGGYNPILGTGNNQLALSNGLAGNAAMGGTGALGAIGGLAPAAANVANPSINGLLANAGMGIAGNPIFNSLTGMASGEFVNPATNPALAGTIAAATTPITNAYQTATAPQNLNSFEAGDRYGSGAQTNSQGQIQYGLGQALSNATAGIVNNAYNTGLNSMLGAGTALGSAYNTGTSNITGALTSAGGLGQSGINNAGNLLTSGYGALNTGLNTAGNIANTGASTYGGLELGGLGGATTAANQAGALNLSGLNSMLSGYGTAGGLYGTAGSTLGSLAQTGFGGASSAYGTGGNLSLGGLNAMLSGYGTGGQLSNAGFGTANTSYGSAGTLANQGALNMGGIAQMAPTLADYPTSQLSTAYGSEWAPLQNAAGIIGTPVSPSYTSTQTTPYYSNTGSNILGGAMGAASLYNTLFPAAGGGLGPAIGAMFAAIP